MTLEELIESSLRYFEEKDVCSMATTEEEELRNACRELGYLACPDHPSLLKQGVCLSLAASAYKLYQAYKECEQPGIRTTA